MPYRLRKRETVSEGCRRILFEQTASMVSALSDHGGGLDERIHDVRKRIKRVRAMLRLISWKAEDKSIDTQEQALRAISHELAPARDATVTLEAFEEMAVELTGGAIDRIRELLSDSVRVAKRRCLAPDKLMALASTLRKTSDTIGRLQASTDGWPALVDGLDDAYRRARKARREAFDDPTPDHLHRARRTAKRLWEQLRLIRRALPKAQGKIVERLEKYASLLGDYRDLHLLQSTLQEAAAHGLEVARFPRLHQLIRQAMGHHLKRARKLGGEIFAKRPATFVAEAKHGWKQWSREKK